MSDLKRPNILYIHSHDTGRYIEPHGYPVRTPNLMALAADGVMFRQCHCANPTCSPSRASLLTGRHAHANGMLGLSHKGFSLNDYGQHIIHTLKPAGYFTALSGIQHIDGPTSDVSKYGSRIGYDAILNHADMRSMWDVGTAADRAAEFLRDAPRQPFFLSVGFSETHRPFPEPGANEDPRYCVPPPGIPDTPETREEWAGYQTLVNRLDTKIGTVLQALHDARLDENTLVICTTDHGIAYPRKKCNLTDEGTGVFLIVRGPAGFSGGRVIDELVSHVDIFPTVTDLLGIDAPPGLHGTSLMPLIRGEATVARDEIFAEVNYHGSYYPQRCIRTKRWKYIRVHEHEGTPQVRNCDAGAARFLWVEGGWAERPLAAEHLYDLMLDPMEQNNLAQSAELAPVKERLSARLRQWMVDTEDPLLNGPIPPASD